MPRRSNKKKVAEQPASPPAALRTKLKWLTILALFIIADVGAFYYIYAKPKSKPDAPIIRLSAEEEHEFAAVDTRPLTQPSNAPAAYPISPPPPPSVPSATPLRQRSTVPSAANYRFKQPSTNPKFGTDFDYSKAVSGNIAELPLTARARSGILVDLDTHRVLWEKEAYKAVPIASMTKMMTILLTLEKLEARPDIGLDLAITVSRAASQVGESSVYLQENEVFALEEYIKATVIKSANDAAWVLGEFVGDGDIKKGLELMNRRAKELKMPGTRYTSPNGLMDSAKQDCLSSAEGMALLAERLLEYPIYLDWATTKGDKIRQLVYRNTNTMIGSVPGVDGLKTGYTRNAASCITVSALRNGRRFIVVLTGMPSSADRNNLASQLLDWAEKR